mmetsp:Transcript_101399/g.293270  ORF Transcript_101399/g.293270 Transcript_101399/m.293270 type:complete len:203 (+) Transcript_101399:284-892(+)
MSPSAPSIASCPGMCNRWGRSARSSRRSRAYQSRASISPSRGRTRKGTRTSSHCPSRCNGSPPALRTCCSHLRRSPRSTRCCCRCSAARRRSTCNADRAESCRRRPAKRLRPRNPGSCTQATCSRPSPANPRSACLSWRAVPGVGRSCHSAQCCRRRNQPGSPGRSSGSRMGCHPWWSTRYGKGRHTAGANVLRRPRPNPHC